MLHHHKSKIQSEFGNRNKSDIGNLKKRCATVFCCFLTLSGLAQCPAPIAQFPYQEDFEASPGAWTSGGTGDDWAWGAPNKPVINAAASGQNCWVTGGLTGSFYALGARSYVESPCFDFTGLPHPLVQFSLWWESEQRFDGAVFQYSLDNGASWQNVGAANEAPNCNNQNWFNTPNLSNLGALANPSHGWSGNTQANSGNCLGGKGSGGWVTARHCMPELGGKANVRLRFAFGAGTTCNDFDGIAFDDVRIENAPPVAANFDSDCAGNYGLAFTDLSTECPDTWHWDFGDPASGAANTSQQQNPQHTFSGGGVYTVTLQASSLCSGTHTATQTVEVPGLSVSGVSPSCFGGHDGRAMAQASPPGGNPVYAWSTTPPQTGPVATHLTAGAYTVTLTQSGFCSVTASVSLPAPDSLQMPPNTLVQAGADTSVTPGSAVLLSGILSDPGRVLSYQWVPAQYLDCDTCLSTLAAPLQSTDYTLIALDTNGCVYRDALTLKVLQGTVYLPNVLRPSSEQGNGYFTAYAGKDAERVALLQIYDRWGSLVFEKRDFPVSDPTQGWDGQIRGKDAMPGVYAYRVGVRFLSGGVEWFSGEVGVVR